jgi:AraC family transcriptional regulator
MKPEVVHKNEIYIAGYGFYGDPFNSSSAWTEENEIGRLWKRFEVFCADRMGELPSSAVHDLGYEVHIWNEETFTTGHYEVFVGFELREIAPVPVDLSIKILPPNRYAVFTLSGSIIVEDWTSRMSSEWLPENGLRQIGNYSFNLYDDRFKGMDRIDESEMMVYVPVE